MTLVGWLADEGNADGTKGGAELTQAEFRAAAPDHVEVIDCPPGGVVKDVDVAVIHNCVSYEPLDLYFDVPTFKYWHDTGPHLSDKQWSALGEDECRAICVSPLQRRKMGLKEKYADLIPPPIPLERFREASKNAGERKGAVALGPWMNWDKTPHAAAEWAKGNGGIDFYGSGPYAPQGSAQVDYEDLPEILARYKTFVHLPREIEPFGRSVVEAWAAGCEVVVNRLVGSRHWIAHEPEKLESAASDFWRLVLNDERN